MEPLIEKQVGNYVVRIHQDEDAENPFVAWDCLGKVVAWHSRYDLGNCKDFADNEAFMEFVKREKPIYLPVYLYDHSGITVSTKSFIGRAQHAEWDSGQVGWIFVTRKDVLEEYGGKKITPSIRKKAEDLLRGELKDFDDYLTGKVYGYTIIKKNKCEGCGNVEEEVVSSCWGYFLGDETLEDSHLMKEALAAVPEQ